jgi:hypothetical protein
LTQRTRPPCSGELITAAEPETHCQGQHKKVLCSAKDQSSFAVMTAVCNVACNLH